MSELNKPAIIQSLEKKLGVQLTPGPTPNILVRDDYALQYALDEKNHLIGLNLAGCELKSLELGSEFQHLQVLNVGRTALRSLHIPAQMKALRELRAYECKELGKVELPDSLEQLYYLDLSECALTQFQLPQGLLALKTLYLQKNKLQNLNWESACPALEFVDLSQNQLSSLTLSNGLPNLRYLYFNDNRLNSLQSLGPLPALQVLHLRNNQLEELPLAFVQGEQMETLYLHNNPLSTLPQEIIANDERKSSLKEVRDYLLELNKGKNIINDRAKLIIVGNGRVGKTSICKQLQGGPFDPDEKYTHGIQIGKLTKKELPGVETSSLQLNVWDFGGQEIFYATHQFFLSDEAIYLLAWTNKKNVEQYQQQSGQALDEKWREEEYWLDNIRRQGASSPILMVQTHSDQYKYKLLPEAQYQEAPYAVEFLDFSANKGYGLEQLKDFIVEKLQTAVPMYGKEFPQSYERVIVRMEKTPENFISLKDFVKVCQESDITTGTESTVLSYLHKSGVVVHFDQEGLKEVVYTNPNWLTQQVYRLINNELAARAGRIDQSYLQKTLPEYDEQEILRFVELLKTFKLIFAAEGEEGVYIAPQYLNRVSDSDKRNLYESHKEDLELGFVFRFPKFMPDNVMVNFLSTYGPYSRKEYWRDCIFFRKNKLKCIVDLDGDKQELRVYTGTEAEARELQAEVCAAFVDLSKNARAEISLDGQIFASWQELKREYTLYLHNPAQQFFAADQKTPLQVKDFLRFFERREFEQIMEKHTVDFPSKNVIMPNIPDLIQASQLKEALEALAASAPTELQADVILLQARYNVLVQRERRNTISQADADVERARINEGALELCAWVTGSPVPEMGAGAGLSHSTSTGETKPRGKKIFISYSQNDKALLQEFLAHLSPLKRNGKISSWHDREILPGDEWDGTIKEELQTADIILLMISATFLSTDYIWDVEIAVAMERHARGNARVIPIFLKPCKWEDAPFSKLNGLPSKGKPVSSHSDRDEAWLEVVNGIARVLDK